jgi:hypothetical protein
MYSQQKQLATSETRYLHAGRDGIYVASPDIPGESAVLNLQNSW